MRAHVYTAANLDEITIDSHKKMDGARLAKQFEVDMCMVNGGRYWLMDEQDVQGGDVVNFDGVNLLYGGEMTGAEMTAQMQTPYAQPDLPQHQLGLARRQAGAPAARAERHGVGDAGVHEGRRPEPDARKPAPGGQQAEGPAQGLDLRDQGADQGTVAQHLPLRRLGGHPPRRTALHLPGLRLRQRHQRHVCTVDRESESEAAHHVEPKRLLHGALRCSSSGDSHRLLSARQCEADKPTATDNRVGTVDASQLPKASRQLGLYVTAEAYDMWKVT